VGLWRVGVAQRRNTRCGRGQLGFAIGLAPKFGLADRAGGAPLSALLPAGLVRTGQASMWYCKRSLCPPHAGGNPPEGPYFRPNSTARRPQSRQNFDKAGD